MGHGSVLRRVFPRLLTQTQVLLVNLSVPSQTWEGSPARANASLPGSSIPEEVSEADEFPMKEAEGVHKPCYDDLLAR